MTTPGTWKDRALEEAILPQLSVAAPWALLEAFSTLTRLSGSEEEEQAVRYLSDRLGDWGVPHSIHRPTCLISLPGRATLRTLGEGGRAYTVKTASFSPATDGQEISGELVYIPGQQPASMTQIFSARRDDPADIDLRGKILITEGMGIALRGVDLRASGAIAAIMVNPGERIHESITTTSWGSPDLDSLGRTPPVPIIMINNPDGRELIERAQQGPLEVALSNEVDVRWRAIPVVVAEIAGTVVPEEFVLFHGHLDSWHVGIGDNATGDATLLEIARVFHANRGQLARSLRVAWWSGHSHGRYAGSTWYADTFALDLLEGCVAHVNCDSPGCRWATVYDDVMRMAAADTLVEETVRDVTGLPTSGLRPLRAGDNSFNNLGIPLYFMLSSTMPEELRQAKGYYGVGGCGGNIAWHTEDDTLEIADRDNLLRDIRVYATALLRSLNAPLHPLDFRAELADMRQHLAGYAEAAGGQFDASAAFAEIDQLAATLDAFYARLAADPPRDAATARAANAVQRRLARELVAVSYSRAGRFRQDPASAIFPLPDLQPATRLSELEPGSDLANAIGVHLTRGQNRLIAACRSARREVERYLNGER